MTTKETLSIHQPEDVLGYIPHLLGYWPEDSLVAITMQGRLLGATLRVDLPSSASPGVRASFSDYVRNHLLADHQADGVVLAFYVDDGWDDGSVICRAMPLLVSLQQSLEAVGLPVRDAWFIGSTYWRSAFCSDPDCCPVPGLPVEQIRNSRINAELIYRGSTVGTSPGSKDNPPVIALRGETDPCVLEAERRFTEQLGDAWQSELCFDAVLAVWRQVLSQAVLHDLAGSRDQAGSPEPRIPRGSSPSLLEGPAGSDLAGFLRATLTVPAWRDAVMVMAAAGPASAKAGAETFKLFSDEVSQTLPFDVLELGLAFVEGERESSAGGGLRPVSSGEEASAFSYGEVLLGLRPPVPDWQMLEALRQTLAVLCSDGEGNKAAAAAFTLQGWIAWCKGNGSLAHFCLTRALTVYPGYRLAELLDDILGQGTISSWARRPESAWGTYLGTRK